MEISFKTTSEEMDAIVKIAQRAEAGGWQVDRMTTVMDLSACHANGCPMDFDRLLTADEFNFWHDMHGISNHVDRETGKLADCFLPRFAKPQTAEA